MSLLFGSSPSLSLLQVGLQACFEGIHSLNMSLDSNPDSRVDADPEEMKAYASR